MKVIEQLVDYLRDRARAFGLRHRARALSPTGAQPLEAVLGPGLPHYSGLQATQEGIGWYTY